MPISEHVYPRRELPREIEIQVLDFMRLAWPDLFSGGDRIRDRLHEAPNAVHFVRRIGDLLVSHVHVLPVSIDLDGRLLRIGGVSNVMTYPEFRGQGHASALMLAAGTHIIAGDFDLGMLFCDPENAQFYERLGWRRLEIGRVLVDERAPVDLVVMILGDPSPLPAVLRLEWSW